MTTDAELAAEFDDLARMATELSENDPAYSLLSVKVRLACEAEAKRQRGNMARAAQALRVKGMLVEALERCACIRASTPEDTYNAMHAALVEARKP